MCSYRCYQLIEAFIHEDEIAADPFEAQALRRSSSDEYPIYSFYLHVLCVIL